MVDVVLVSVVIGAVAGLLRAARVGDREAEVLFKGTASAAFVVLGVVGRDAGDPIGTWLVIGLALCAVGDVMLIWQRSFDLGLWTFLLGHIAYVAAFLVALPVTTWPPWLALPAAALSLGALSWLWPHLGRRAASVSAYIAVITVMTWGALSVAAAGALPWTVAAGASSFYLSDLAVARQRFVTPDFLNRAVGLPLYYAGQVLLALSV